MKQAYQKLEFERAMFLRKNASLPPPLKLPVSEIDEIYRCQRALDAINAECNPTVKNALKIEETYRIKVVMHRVANEPHSEERTRLFSLLHQCIELVNDEEQILKPGYKNVESIINDTEEEEWEEEEKKQKEAEELLKKKKGWKKDIKLLKKHLLQTPNMDPIIKLSINQQIKCLQDRVKG